LSPGSGNNCNEFGGYRGTPANLLHLSPESGNNCNEFGG